MFCIPAPYVPGTGCRTRLESRIFKNACAILFMIGLLGHFGGRGGEDAGPEERHPRRHQTVGAEASRE